MLILTKLINETNKPAASFLPRYLSMSKHIRLSESCVIISLLRFTFPHQHFFLLYVCFFYSFAFSRLSNFVVTRFEMQLVGFDGRRSRKQTHSGAVPECTHNPG